MLVGADLYERQLLQRAAVVAAEGEGGAAVRGAAEQALVAQHGLLGRRGGAGAGAAGPVADHGEVAVQQQRRACGGAAERTWKRPRAGHGAAAVGGVGVACGERQRKTASGG